MNGLLQRHVLEQAERRPGAPAVRTEEETLPYGQLAATAWRMARTLSEAGCRRGDRVAVALPKSPRTLAAMVGILQADCAYVPVDPDWPVARTARVLRRSEPRVLLADDGSRGLLMGLADDGVLDDAPGLGWMDTTAPPLSPRFSWEDVERAPAAPVDASNRPEDAAHILFTSGSTGEPKGVVVTHQSADAFVTWANRTFDIGPEDRLSGHPPLHFDLSTYDVFGAFAAGAELHPVPPELNLLPHRIAAFIRRRRLTRWFSVPSLLTWMVRAGAVEQDDFPELRHLHWCGEVFPTAALIPWMERLPHVTFTNLYGPTEAAIASSYFVVPEVPGDEREPIPIGRPCGGEDLRVVGEDLVTLPAGEAGELCIEGVGLSPGYWRDPERTAEVFVTAPDGARIYRTGDLARRDADGLFWFLGRTDSQIKSRGYRIELGEIETALNAVPELAECAVVAVDANGFQGQTICAAYVPEAGVEMPPATVRGALADHLPRYMLPSRWLVQERLPRNANGKIDRRALKERFERREVATTR